MRPLIRVVEAGLGAGAPVRLVLSNVDEPDLLRSRWAASGAAVERSGDRLHATSTVDALARAAGRAFGAEHGDAVAHLVEGAVTAWGGSPPAWEVAGTTLPCDQRPLIMGVVNVTPDSFSDGGILYPDGHPDAALSHARALVAEGADLLDVGGESTRPGAAEVPAAEERDRVLPIVAGLAPATVVSIDTRKAEVARAAVAAGAAIVNDVAGAADPALLEVVAASGSGYVLMHTRGTPAQMQNLTSYDDVLAEVYEFLAEGLDRCAAAGIAPARIAIDPGIGFAKTPAHNLALLRGLRQLRSLGRPVLVGASRKSFLGVLTGGADVDDRLAASLACAAAAVAAGAAVLRVHDVAATTRVAAVMHAIAEGSAPAPVGP